MFESHRLRRALLDNDLDAIRALADKNGKALLNKRLPLSFSREGERQPGDEWLKKVFSGPTPLAFALMTGRDDLARALIDMGASPLYRVDHNYPNMLFVAAALGRGDLLAEWLETYRAAARVENDDRDTLLHISCQHKQPDSTRVLLAHGFYTSAHSGSGRSPLLYAEEAGDLESIKLLHAAARGQLPKRGDTRPVPRPDSGLAATAVTTAPPANGWHVIDAARVARVTEVPAIGYRLTEVFNFASGEVLRLNRNLETGAESAVVTSFADMPAQDVLAEAAARLGRVVDPVRLTMVTAPKRLIKKPQ